ncbi:MAG: hypothetical protein GC186_15670 [Rhodobacteraceae bacterium]|nr:hypothetical protein [Paracoccaceae bacterium]
MKAHPILAAALISAAILSAGTTLAQACGCSCNCQACVIPPPPPPPKPCWIEPWMCNPPTQPAPDINQ